MQEVQFEDALDYARAQDVSDPLAHFRPQFHFPKQADGTPIIYLCGNSLGLQPRLAQELMQEEMNVWKELAVEGHFKAKRPWMTYHEEFSQQLAPIVGALPQEITVMNTLSVNLHLMMVSFYRPTKTRYKIVIEGGAFPSDKYAVDSQLRFHGIDPQDGLIQLRPRMGEDHLRTEDILQTLEREKDSIALVMLSGINYYTGQCFDMQAITKKGHEIGAMVGFDLAHAAGNVKLQLHDWGMDFAVWCHYKYLNSGPGCIAGAFVHERHLGRKDIPRFEGWWGHHKESRFKMPATFEPAPNADAWQISNAPILAMVPMRASLALFNEAGMDRLLAKSKKLTAYLEFLLNQLPTDRIRILTPKDPKDRGAQLSIQVKGADRSLFDDLVENGVIGDWREPDVIRISPAPIYNSFEDVYQMVQILKKCLNI
ncbi:kynureninase [Saprospira sp. CCB-QB6]|uniref:kynureninase n=1 Tax=Saprospira sp. CCB-QB6 TaxID=3023936 RepID=UPI00234921B7|nr:kynureninase [Saprospira sp. CCB-QB6]WCL81844.1 kynureninase [Saprospira sp. CCB-QB6]